MMYFVWFNVYSEHTGYFFLQVRKQIQFTLSGWNSCSNHYLSVGLYHARQPEKVKSHTATQLNCDFDPAHKIIEFVSLMY